MNKELDTGKTIRQITKLFAEIEELKQEIAALRETVERLNIKLELNNEHERILDGDSQ